MYVEVSRYLVLAVPNAVLDVTAFMSIPVGLRHSKSRTSFEFAYLA